MTKTSPACRISVAEAGRDSGTLRTTATLLREALCLAIQGMPAGIALWDLNPFIRLTHIEQERIWGVKRRQIMPGSETYTGLLGRHLLPDCWL